MAGPSTSSGPYGSVPSKAESPETVAMIITWENSRLGAPARWSIWDEELDALVQRLPSRQATQHQAFAWWPATKHPCCRALRHANASRSRRSWRSTRRCRWSVGGSRLRGRPGEGADDVHGIQDLRGPFGPEGMARGGGGERGAVRACPARQGMDGWAGPAAGHAWRGMPLTELMWQRLQACVAAPCGCEDACNNRWPFTTEDKKVTY